jgi:hypothetical protein
MDKAFLPLTHELNSMTPLMEYVCEINTKTNEQTQKKDDENEQSILVEDSGSEDEDEEAYESQHCNQNKGRISWSHRIYKISKCLMTAIGCVVTIIVILSLWTGFMGYAINYVGNRIRTNNIDEEIRENNYKICKETGFFFEVGIGNLSVNIIFPLIYESEGLCYETSLKKELHGFEKKYHANPKKLFRCDKFGGVECYGKVKLFDAAVFHYKNHGGHVLVNNADCYPPIYTIQNSGFVNSKKMLDECTEILNNISFKTDQ